MAERTLVLSFDAPLQSWGVGAKGTVKTTANAPSLSGVVGLIANALGHAREDDISDLAVLTMGSRTDRSGVLVRDFYSAGTTTGIGTRVESRDKDGRRTFKDTVSKDGVIGEKYFLAGALFTVAISGEEGIILRAAEALQRPARVLYLGRRACPMNSRPVQAVLEETDLEAVLRSFPLRKDLKPDVRGSAERTWVRNQGWCADERMLLVLPTHPGDPGARMHYDVPVLFSDKHRRYGVRYVRHSHVDRADLITKEAA